jgi:ASC-1-like (ASCH) protein
MHLEFDQTEDLLARRRKLAKKYETLDNMLKYMDIEDVTAVLQRQEQVVEEFAKLNDLLAILN